MMHDSVRDAFLTVASQVNGPIDHMYCDNNRDVMCGIKYPIPSDDAATMLSWRWRDTNKRATSKEIRAEWKAIRWMGQTGLDNSRSPAFYAKYAQLVLTSTEITRITISKMFANENLLEWIFHDMRFWPADAQMAALQIVWHDGIKVFDRNSEHFQDTLIDAVQNQDWISAAESYVAEDPAMKVLIDRLFKNAAKVSDLAVHKAKFWGNTEPHGY